MGCLFQRCLMFASVSHLAHLTIHKGKNRTQPSRVLLMLTTSVDWHSRHACGENLKVCMQCLSTCCYGSAALAMLELALPGDVRPFIALRSMRSTSTSTCWEERATSPSESASQPWRCGLTSNLLRTLSESLGSFLIDQRSLRRSCLTVSPY